MPIDNTDFVKISTYSDMEKRERFVRFLDPSKHRLIKILGEYHLVDKIECGLCNCRTMHNHGILIQTEDSTETNIGNCCGAREFPGQYDSVRKTFNTMRTFNIQSDVINAYLEKVPVYETQLNALWNSEHGGRWSDECREVYLQNCPPSVKTRVVSMIGSGGYLYKEIVIEEEDENALNLGYSRTERIERQSVGVLVGSQALLQTPKTALKEVRDIMDSYKVLTVAGTIMSGTARRKFTNQVGSIPAKLDNALKLIGHAQDCFTSSNMGQLMKIADGNEREGIRQMLRAIEKVPTSKKMRKVG